MNAIGSDVSGAEANDGDRASSDPQGGARPATEDHLGAAGDPAEGRREPEPRTLPAADDDA